MKNIKSIIILICIVVFSSISEAQVGTDFEIRNAQQNGNLYEFDVYMRANQTNTFHTRGLLYISYNTAAFGISLADNGQISAIKGLLLAGFDPAGNAKYMTNHIVDNSESTFAIDWRSNYMGLAASNNWHTEVGLAFGKIYHISMPMIDPTKSANIRIEQALMPGEQFYITPSTSSETPYQIGSLPVELLSFEGKLLDDATIQLDWATTIEINNSHFEIQRFEDGEFQKIGQVQGSGNSTQQHSYNFNDASPLPKLNSYRLKQIDFDGSYHYSNIVEIKTDNSFSLEFDLYPSPATDFVKLKSKTNRENDLHLFITDGLGRVIWSKDYAKDAGSILRINISKFAAGTYFLNADDSHFSSLKLVKI